MREPKQAHSGLQTLGRVIGFFLLFFFVLLVPIYTMLFGISRTLLSENFLQSRLTDDVIRTEVVKVVRGQLGDQAKNAGDEVDINPDVVNSPRVHAFLNEVISQNVFNSLVNTLLSNSFAYLTGEKELEEISINTQGLQETIRQSVKKGITTLPVCTSGETSIFASEGENPEDTSSAALCKPAGTSDEELLAFAQSPELQQTISKNVPATLTLKELPNFDVIHYQAEQVRHYYKLLFTLVLFGGVVLALMLVVGAFLWHQHLWHGLQTLGVALFVPLVAVFGLTFFGRMFLERVIVNNTLTDDPIGSHVLTAGWHLISPILSYIANLSMALAGFGLVLFILMEVIRHTAVKRESEIKTDIKPQKKRASSKA